MIGGSVRGDVVMGNVGTLEGTVVEIAVGSSVG